MPRSCRGCWTTRIALAEIALHKPLVFGEFGFERASERLPGSRARWSEVFLSHFLKRSAEGALVWLYEPGDNPRRSHSISANLGDRDSLHVRRVLRGAGASWPSARPPACQRRGWRGPSCPSSRRSARRAAPASRTGASWCRARSACWRWIPWSSPGRASSAPACTMADALETVWGEGEGSFEYRFEAPPQLPRALRIEARLSSELPGVGAGRDPRDGSDIEVSVDGELVATVRAKPDDGSGDVIRAELTDQRALRKVFGKLGRHALHFRALPSRYAGGLCIYGAPTGNAPLAPEAARDLTAIRISLVR